MDVCVYVDINVEKMAHDSSSSSRRLSQIFDPLSRLSELTRESRSTPTSPRLLPRRSRDSNPSVPGGVSFEILNTGPETSTSSTVNWQEKCLELQLELHRSRSQATRTRDMLREKVSFVVPKGIFC